VAFKELRFGRATGAAGTGQIRGQVPRRFSRRGYADLSSPLRASSSVSNSKEMKKLKKISI
jgi:hypothetical protein